MHLPTWKNPKHAQQWINTLKQYVFPRIGSKKISTISSADILTVLTPIWTSKPETASRVRQRMGAVLKWSIAQGWRVDNPAEAISQALPKRDKTANNHHTSLPYEQVSNAIQTIQDSSAGIATKLSFEFLILTAARSGEVRGASWDEISGNTWTIPKSRMKARRSHRVLLSERCMEILAEAERLKDSSGFIFTNGNGKPLSDATLSKLLREQKIEAVPHGFRSSFRVWASEQTSIPHQVSEFALAHVIGNKAEAAYQRSDLFEKRRTLMTMWADYLDETKAGAVVVPIKKQVKTI
jgi:integrase